MHGVLDGVVVAVVLTVSVVYAAFALGPKSLRRRSLSGAGILLRKLPDVLGIHALARRLDSTAAQKAAGACGGCDNCGPAEPSSTSEAPPKEVRIPLSSIGRR